LTFETADFGILSLARLRVSEFKLMENISRCALEIAPVSGQLILRRAIFRRRVDKRRKLEQPRTKSGLRKSYLPGGGIVPDLE
jgi:hypothetical protein